MRIVFMGSPRFAVPSLERFIESDHEVALVVTQPDRPAGRGRKIQAPPVKEKALEQGLTVAQPEKIRGNDAFLRQLRDLAPDVIVVVAYGKILPREVLETPRLGCVNLHASLLPKYRGAAPVNWAVVRGETETGVTIMLLDEGMDTGPMIAKEAAPILEDDDAESLAGMLSVVGSHALLEAVDRAEAEGGFSTTEQDHSVATYAPILKKEHGRIYWDRPTDELVCHVRGFKPWPGAQTEAKAGPLKILKVEPLWEAAVLERPKAMKQLSGTVVDVMKAHDGFVVRTATGLLLVTEAQLSGKRPMSGADLVNGKLVQVGERLRGFWEELPEGF